MSFRLLAGAKRELMNAARVYESKRPGLGDAFLDAVVEALHRLERWQHSGPPMEARYRRALLRRFPYAIIYRPAPQGIIVVVAIMHLKRRPGYWLARARREDT